jgi:hypothetical protein
MVFLWGLSQIKLYNIYSMSYYEDYFALNHPIIKTENPTWTIREITNEIGKRWSLQNMRIGKFNENLCVMYSSRKILIDYCGKYNELKLYLESYQIKYGSEALLKLAETMSI